MAPVIRVAAVDDDRMLLDGLVTWLSTVPDLRLVGAASTVDQLLAGLPGPVDVVLLDLVLRDRSDAAGNVRRLVARGHRVLVLSVWARPDQVVATFAAGSSGYVTKDHDLPALAVAIREVHAGRPVFSTDLAFACLGDSRPVRPALSPRERAVLLAYASGMTLKAAARHLGIKPETARTYLDRVKAKYHDLGRPTRTKLDLADRVREDDLEAG
ncbi:Transcriptional regulatory protein DevR (DosR) [Micromonospora sp. MW-13]|uniref:response regulator transcription factor n=1 Tax=Micromonospora sp. MW-13 TaxID=2094022 RepID=UPI000ED3C730|nr:response regulator transcription factor [Micromonospora sp. MW-13]RGC65952.1 Transcriptional regulatory protein DevR (DosR) [Micromonospora sp. MW-13]